MRNMLMLQYGEEHGRSPRACLHQNAFPGFMKHSAEPRFQFPTRSPTLRPQAKAPPLQAIARTIRDGEEPIDTGGVIRPPIMSTASEILGRIEDDDVFRGFLEAGFDPAAFASKIVKADVGKAGGAVAPVLLQGERTALPGAGVGVGGGDQRGLVTSAESVSSQAEITLDVSVCSITMLAHRTYD